MACKAFFIIAILTITLFLSSSVYSIPLVENKAFSKESFIRFQEAPIYQNEPQCAVSRRNSVCDPNLVHVAITLDGEYLRGSVALIHSILKHTHCPKALFFHLIASKTSKPGPKKLTQIVKSTFPYLSFKVYPFDENLVKDLISPSIRPALDNPLNYARTYIADMLDPCIRRVIYLDSDTIVVDEIRTLWEISLPGSIAIGAPEYCHTNFTKYFNNNFWSDTRLSSIFKGKRPCYFNTGVMVMDLVKFREGKTREKVENWMKVQKEKRIYELGSLPPFLLLFGGNIQQIDHRWNQHGLGGDNLVNNCRGIHSGRVSLLHWSGKGKPWVRLDARNYCPVDILWAPYDLHLSRTQIELQEQR